MIRYQIVREGESICIVSFSQSKERIKITVRPLEEKEIETEQVRKLLQELRIEGPESLSKIVESCLGKLAENEYSYKQVESGDYQVTLKFGVGERQIGTSTALINGIDESFGNTIMSEALERIKNNSINKLEKKAHEMLVLIQNGKHQEAFELYQDDVVNTNLYLAGKVPDVLIDTLFQINHEEIHHKSRVELSLQRIGICEINRCHERAENDARWLLEQETPLADNVIFNVRLALGNALAAQELYEAAEFHYNEALNTEKEIEAQSKAWAYYNIGHVLRSQEKMNEAVESYMKAGDIWLNKGNHQQATRAYMGVIRHYEQSQPREAIRILEDNINHLVKLEESITNKNIGVSHVLGYLYFHKGNLAFELKQYTKAKEAFFSSYLVRKNLIGIDDELEATLYYLMIVCRVLGEFEEADSWQIQIEEIKGDTLKTEDSHIREQIINILNNDSELDSNKLGELRKDIEKTGSIHLQLMLLLTLATRQAYEKPDIALQLLDQAMKLNIKNYPDEHVLVLQLYAEIMKKLSRIEKAYDYLCEAIHVKPTYLQLYPEVIYLAQELGKENAILDHALSWAKIENDNVVPWQIIATQYEKTGQPREAYDAFNKALAVAPLNKEIQEKLKEDIGRVTDKVMRLTDIKQRAYPSVDDFLNVPMDQAHKTIQQKMSEMLTDFQRIIEIHHTPDFWRTESGRIKWVSSPEKKAQEYLLLYLRSHLHQDIEVLDEVTIGEGRMDVYIRIPPGISFILEIKMCGEGYSSTYAKGAIEQTKAYMDKKDCTMGYLVVFDARKRDIGKGFEQFYQFGSKQIQTKIIDIRHKAPSRN